MPEFPLFRAILSHNQQNDPVVDLRVDADLTRVEENVNWIHEIAITPGDPNCSADLCRLIAEVHPRAVDQTVNYAPRKSPHNPPWFVWSARGV